MPVRRISPLEPWMMTGWGGTWRIDDVMMAWTPSRPSNEMTAPTWTSMPFWSVSCDVILGAEGTAG
jgi:hypothetical protein